ncbi:MAG: type II toxin-antitoxin system death-on-curing family toxin [Actinomycetales bacterium]|nr:type II toxin-antitoxin system death-on-curing family toxin [Actinomycetales bacterium]
MFGSDAYPSIHEKAGALMESLARNHTLIDGNERLALTAVIVFLGINGRRLAATNDEAYDFTIEVATRSFADVSAIARRLEHMTVPR